MGAPISSATKRAVRERLGAELIESWGNSEGLGTITEREDLDKRPDSVGRPFLTDQLYVLDEAGKRLGPGEIGRLAGLADSRLLEYQNRRDLNEELLRGDLAISEDLGDVDADGYLHLSCST